MKKIVSLMLCCTVLLCALPVFSTAAENLSFIVATDVHQNYEAAEQGFVTRNNYDADYKHVFSSGKLATESPAIFEAFLDAAAKSSCPVVIITGDLADSGTVAQHEKVAQRLSLFEQTTGKRVYVINGNHDKIATDNDAFKSLYAEFGYNEALSVEAGSCSYTAELNDTYRLIAIDTCTPITNKPGLSDAEMVWIKEQLKLAKQDGKKLIGISHHNLLDHFTLEDKIYAAAVVASSYGIGELYADNGVELNFCGHTHDQDIAVYQSKAGNKFYDVVTGSLVLDPCPYRTVVLNENGAEITTEHISSVDMSLMPNGLSAAAFADAENDFLLYAKKSYYVGMKTLLLDLLNGANLCSLLKLTPEDKTYSIVYGAGERLNTSLQLPLYTADAAEGQNSIQELCSQYGVKLPSSDYQSTLDLALALYRSHIVGDENCAADSTECLILYRALAVCINYSLGELSGKDYAQVLTMVSEMLGIDKYLPAPITSILGNGIQSFEGLELSLTYALSPLIEGFTDDTPPADNNVTLNVYGSLSSSQGSSFIEWLKGIWKKIVKMFNMLLIFGGIK